MKTRFAKVLVLFTLVIAMVAMTALPAMAATTVNVLDGQISITDTADSNTVSNGVVTIQAKGSLFSKATNTVTIVNETESKAELSFSYAASTYNSFTVDGAAGSASGTYSAVLESGASVSLTLVSNSGMSNRTATLTLSNFSLVAASDASNVTITYDSAYGAVTAGGPAVESGTTQNVTLADGVELVATKANGGTFLGWIDADTSKILSKEASYTLYPASDMNVKAVFTGANSAPYFGVGAETQKSESVGLLGMSKRYYYTVSTDYIFDDLNEAVVAAAASSSTKAVVLLNSATLPAGDYNIPSGVTLLIPFDASNTLYKNEAVSILGSGYSTPTAYRTLTLAEGVNLTVDGAISLSAKHASAQGSHQKGGAPTGAVSFVKMNEGSSITVKNGGYLYVYGFITGSGSITAKSGANVFENFQIADFRGGTQSTDMDNGVFPFNQYYIQNIEVPLTLEYGAIESSYTSVYMSSSTFGSAVAFIGPKNAMFNLTSGAVTKWYDGTTDRLMVNVNGDLKISPISMTIGTSTLDSEEYNLPVNGNISVMINSGSSITITQDVAMLPGVEMFIAKGATATMGSGCNVYFYDADNWGNYCYGGGNKAFVPVQYAPGKTYTRTAADLKDVLVEVDGFVDASQGYVYTTAGGANIRSNGTGKVLVTAVTDAVTYQLVQNTGYTEIPVTSAKLQNADGSCLETSKGSTTEARQYVYTDGAWICDTEVNEHTYEATVVEPTCTTDGYTEHKCTICGDSYQDAVVEAIGHTEVIDAAEEATCTETGLTEGKHCSVCNEVLTAQEEIPALGHTEESIPAVDATCEAPGLTEGTVCTACGTVLVAQEEAPALGHTEVIDEAVDATCTATGLTEGSHCDRCKEILIAQEVIPATGHSYETSVIDPTCTEEGYTEYTCGVCNDHYIGDKVSALGHDEVIDEGKAATCTETGLTEGKHCDRCKEVLTAQEVISALGHTEVIDEAVDATCTATGLTEGKHCSVCNEVLTAQEVVPAKGHSYGTWVVTAPTYKEAGSQSKTCSVCGDVVTEEIPVLANPVTGWNITLKDNIGVNFVMALKDADVVTVTVNGNAVECKIADGKFSVNVAAAQMMDEIAISVNGLPLAKTYSVRGYADEILNGDYDEAAKTLVKNMLVYGGAAQTYFGYNASNLASAGIEVTAAAPEGGDEIAVSDSLSGISFYGAALVHETKTAVRIYFTGNIDGLDFGDYVPVEKNGMYYVEVSGINPQDLGNAVVVVVTDGTDSLSVSYSPLNYMVRMYNKADSSDNAKTLVQALYGYYLAAAAYTA